MTRPKFLISRPSFGLVFVLLGGLGDASLVRAIEAQTSQQPEPASPLDTVRNLLKKGNYAEAETRGRELLASVEAQAGADSSRIADVLDVLVETLWRGGKTKAPGSRQLAERVLRIRERAQGPDHPDVAASLNNLAIMGCGEPSRSLAPEL